MKTAILNELERIRLKNKGILNPEIVVKTASKKNNVLHQCFTWDNEKAGHAYRLWQARQLIRLVVQIIPNNESEKIIRTRTYVSMKDDRVPKGGYRTLVDVLSDREMYNKLLQEAFEEFKIYQLKYHNISELNPLFETMKAIQEDFEKELVV